jgi:hypothetical protein
MRQLSLFKKTNQRGIAPPPLEFETHCVLADICRRWLSPRWRFTHLPLGEHREHRINRKGRRFSPSGGRLKRMGVVPGWPDFVFAGPNKHVVWLELKRKRLGRVSAEQSEIGAHLEASGFDFLITDDVGKAVRWLCDLGVLSASIEVQ